MGKIILEISFPSGPSQLRVFEQASVRIGRGFGNDVILQDPYVSAEHAVVSISAEGKIEIVDSKSENGTFLMLPENMVEPRHIVSGGMFVVGHTKIRVFLPDHPIAATRKLAVEKPVKPVASLTLWYALVGFFVLYFFHIASHFPYDPMVVSQFVFYEFLIFLGVCFVAGIWALVGRMINQKACFGQQLTLMCFFAIVIIPIENICGFFGYAFASMAVEALSGIFLGGSALSVLIFHQLSIATALGRRLKIVSSIAVPAVLIALGFSGAMAFRNEFVIKPDFYSRSKPPFVHPVRVFKSGEFISQAEEVFEKLSDEEKDFK